MSGLAVRVLVGLVRGYQWVLSPVLTALGARCRFQPTCSQYAVDVIRLDGPLRGSVRALGRILRCHPWHPGGFDPADPSERASKMRADEERTEAREV